SSGCKAEANFRRVGSRNTRGGTRPQRGLDLQALAVIADQRLAVVQRFAARLAVRFGSHLGSPDELDRLLAGPQRRLHFQPFAVIANLRLAVVVALAARLAVRLGSHVDSPDELDRLVAGSQRRLYLQSLAVVANQRLAVVQTCSA